MTSVKVVTQGMHDSVTPFAELALPEPLARDLQSDHAGETGAVYIYHGILAVSRDPQVREFARHHLATEQQHLAFFEHWLPQRFHSRLIPVWRLAGFMLGALPALFGARAVWVTIEAVETFVEGHYNEQIVLLADDSRWAGLRAALIEFCADEVVHRDDAAGRQRTSAGWLARMWSAQVNIGSRIGVWLARRI